MKKEFKILPEAEGTRLDAFLSAQISALSRTLTKKIIDQGLVLVNGKARKGSCRLKSGDLVSAVIPEQKQASLEPFDHPLQIVYEDEDILVVNKPNDLTMHPPNEGYHRTLVNALYALGKTLAPISPLRPGVVHRLDRETSGLVVLAKTKEAYYNLVEQFKARTVNKEYLALVWGVPSRDKITVDLPLSRDSSNRLKMKVTFVKAKNARTEVTVLKRLAGASYLSLHLITGRMHQIRVHLKFLGYPIVGDRKYGKKDDSAELMLHSHKLGFRHPGTGEEIEFKSPLPVYFEKFISDHEKN